MVFLMLIEMLFRMLMLKIAENNTIPLTEMQQKLFLSEWYIPYRIKASISLIWS